jgi:hypothetical protein
MLGVCFLKVVKRKEFKIVFYQFAILVLLGMLISFFSTGPGTAINTVDVDFNIVKISQCFIIPVFGILLSFFGMNSILANIPSRENSYFDILTSWSAYGTTIGCFIVIIYVLVIRRLVIKEIDIFLFFLIYALFYTYFYMSGSFVGHEDRYFFVPSLILFIFIVKYFSDTSMGLLPLSVGIVFSLYGIWNFGYRFKEYNSTYAPTVLSCNFVKLRTPISLEQATKMQIIGNLINGKFLNYAVFTTNENYFYLKIKKPLVHDWNFQIMGFEKFDYEKIGQIKIADNCKLKGILFISPYKIKNYKVPIFEVPDFYIYELKNTSHEN